MEGIKGQYFRHAKTSFLICCTNHLTCSCAMETFVLNEAILSTMDFFIDVKLPGEREIFEYIYAPKTWRNFCIYSLSF